MRRILRWACVPIIAALFAYSDADSMGMRGGGGASFHGGGGSFGGGGRASSLGVSGSARHVNVEAPSRPVGREPIPARPPSRPAVKPRPSDRRPDVRPGPETLPRPAGDRGTANHRPVPGPGPSAGRPPVQGFKPFPGTGGAARADKDNMKRLLDDYKRGDGRKAPGKGVVAGGAAAGAALAAHELAKRPGELRPGGLPGPGGKPHERPRPEAAERIRTDFAHHHRDAFTRDWWAARRHVGPYGPWPYPYRHPWPPHWGPHHWWRPAVWGSLAVFCGGGLWNTPIVYDYGADVYYEGDTVYVQGQAPIPAEEYYGQAAALAENAPKTVPEETEWTPLGVFALTQGGQAEANAALQLAVSQDGVIAGTYYNAATDVTRPVKGTVDKTTQRAAWTFADGRNQDIVMEAGIYNLTQDQAEMLVHFGKKTTQQWTMVRLKDPDDA